MWRAVIRPSSWNVDGLVSDAFQVSGADAYLCDCAVPTVEHTPEMSHMSVSEGVFFAKQENIKLYITHQFAGQSVRLEAKELYDNAVVVSERTTYKV